MKSKLKKILSFIMIICISASLGVYIPVSAKSSDNAGQSSLTVTFSKSSGVYSAKFDLKLTCAGSSKIYYTTDGSNPTTSSTRVLYKTAIKVAGRSNDNNYVSAVDPFLFDAANVAVNSKRDGFISTLNSKPSNSAVDKCTVIRAAALDKQGKYTAVATNTYFVGNIADHIKGIKDSCKAAGTDLAIMSLSIDYKDMFDPKTGIYVKGDIYNNALKDYLKSGNGLKADTSRRLDANYYQTGNEWERNVHVDYLESDGTSTSLELQQDCGIRIQGVYSRSDLQKGFRLIADKDYGKKNFDYPFFGTGLKDDTGATMAKFKSLTLRAGGNCAFTAKYIDTYWQSLVKDMKVDTQTSRPCIVYIDGEYWGLYILQEDYSQDYFADTHGVNKDDVVLYKEDEEKPAPGYKLDLGSLPKGVTDESYYLKDLLDFFQTHKDLSSDTDYNAFSKLVDIDSARNYYAIQIWINNKWDWPGKNWSIWKTTKVDDSNPYADGRWRFIFYDLDFGGVMGNGDVNGNAIRDDGYDPSGLLYTNTPSLSRLIYAYLMSNKNFRNDFATSLQALTDKNFKYNTAISALDKYNNTYSPLFDQFFARYPGAGTKYGSISGGFGSYQCIKSFLTSRSSYIKPMLDYVNQFYNK